MLSFTTRYEGLIQKDWCLIGILLVLCHLNRVIAHSGTHNVDAAIDIDIFPGDAARKI